MQAIEYKTNVHKGYIKLQVPVAEQEVRVIVIWDNEDDNKKNYNLTQLKKLVKEGAQKDIFTAITDPVKWQKKLRLTLKKKSIKNTIH